MSYYILFGSPIIKIFIGHPCLCAEFKEATDLLSADPGAATLSTSAFNESGATAGTPSAGEDVKLDLSEDEEAQEESSEVVLLPGPKLNVYSWCLKWTVTNSNSVLSAFRRTETKRWLLDL